MSAKIKKEFLPLTVQCMVQWDVYFQGSSGNTRCREYTSDIFCTGSKGCFWWPSIILELENKRGQLL